MIGAEIHKFAEELWPINRSITGPGVRHTLKKIAEHLPDLKIQSIKSGTRAFDWIVPKEWIVNEAFIIGPRGEKICDFSENNLHLLGYSTPFTGELDLYALAEHLYTLPDQPNAIPYITSYYEDRWGFCLTQQQFDALEDGIYKVHIDTELRDGVLNYAELLIKGKSEKEIFLSTYICHPSMANNELSGPTVVTFLAKWLSNIPSPNFSYRIVFIPETIGSIVYLSKNHAEMKRRIFAGFNVSCVGDNRAYSYLPSRNGTSISDEVALHVLKWTDPRFKQYTWLERGSDERQYCAPGIDLPIASIMRTKYGEYPEYHTSLDNLRDVVSAEGLDGGYWALRHAIEAIEQNKCYRVTVLCEPHMGKRNLYPTLSTKNTDQQAKFMMDFLSLCDGKNSLLYIADFLNVPIWKLYDVTAELKKHNLIKANEEN
tara:strand:- start:9535 stop:10821 length:1287 start_codon:yes stop_codon:yes gene_type:complete